jgi:hypothetical protein
MKQAYSGFHYISVNGDQNIALHPRIVCTKIGETVFDGPFLGFPRHVVDVYSEVSRERNASIVKVTVWFKCILKWLGRKEYVTCMAKFENIWLISVLVFQLSVNNAGGQIGVTYV